MRKLNTYIASAEKRTALAWDCIRAAPDNTPDFIEYFELPDEGERCRLALTYFRRPESPDPYDLQKFDLNSPESLKVAIHAASKVMQMGAHSESLDRYISNAVKDAKL
jgi:hypothetical protein